MKKRLTIALAAIGVLASACGSASSGSLGNIGNETPRSPSPTRTSPSASPKGSPSPTGGQPTTPATSAPSPTSGSGSGQTVSYQVWFHYGEGLFVTRRTETFTAGVGAAAVESLLEGPTDAETIAGVGTQVPVGTELLGLDISGGLATVDLSSDFGSGGGSLSVTMRVAQVVYTLTQFPTVNRVAFHIDGRPVDAISGDGIIVDPPRTRGDYDELLPPILVTSPLIGAKVSSPVTIAGTANVFEATVSIRILDAQGREIARTFTTATCGTGCRGDYSKAVSFTVGVQQKGTIEVFESSAQDGRPINVIKIPVTLVP